MDLFVTACDEMIHLYIDSRQVFEFDTYLCLIFQNILSIFINEVSSLLGCSTL